MHPRTRPFLGHLCAVILPALLGTSPAALAADYVITDTTDSDAADVCSLRNALRSIINQTSHGTCAPGNLELNTITLGPGSFDFSQHGQEFLPILAQPRSLEIRGAGADSTVIDLGGTNRFLWVEANWSLTVEDLAFENGRGSGAGGALRVAEADLSLRRSRLEDNQTDEQGGAVYFFDGNSSQGDPPRSLVIEDSMFVRNRVNGELQPADGKGGALRAVVQIAGSSARLDGVVFEHNRIERHLISFGSAAAIFTNAGAEVTLEDCVARFNLFFDSGIAAAWNGGIFVNSFTGGELSIRNLFMFGNGGVALVPGTSPNIFGKALTVQMRGSSLVNLDRIEIRDSAFSPDLDDEGPFPESSQVRLALEDQAQALLTNVLVEGAREFSSNAPDRGIRLVAREQASIRALHLTVTEHELAGVRVEQEGSSSVEIANSILTDNDGGNLDVFSGSVSQQANCVACDARFVDPAGDDFRLAPDSPAVDAGDDGVPGVTTLDLDGQPRTQGRRTDQGAYELSLLFADGFESGNTSAWS